VVHAARTLGKWQSGEPTPPGLPVAAVVAGMMPHNHGPVPVMWLIASPSIPRFRGLWIQDASKVDGTSGRV
jgi:hypothetical protein